MGSFSKKDSRLKIRRDVALRTNLKKRKIYLKKNKKKNNDSTI
ncbi:MAG: hypothetical protein FD544_000049 [Pelagibacterales bacterium]|jgi:hypothetical protein|nr:hypothetical protein [Pelagibacterales bacterium]